MEKLQIYEYQAKAIENALRIVSNTMKSKNKETCLDRDVEQSLEMIRNVIKGEIDILVKR
jgi:hypothetical protein